MVSLKLRTVRLRDISNASADNIKSLASVQVGHVVEDSLDVWKSLLQEVNFPFNAFTKELCLQLRRAFQPQLLAIFERKKLKDQSLKTLGLSCVA